MDIGARSTISTLIEPPQLIKHFLENPPIGFCTCEKQTEDAPFFSAPLDLLSTANEHTRRVVTSLPFYALWQKYFRWTCGFFGTTVSEYLPLSGRLAPAVLSEHLLRVAAHHFALTIFKDLPTQSPLLSAAANRYAHEFAAECKRRGCVLLEGQALAYVAIDFSSSEQYLARMSRARRRDLKRKLRSHEKFDIQCLLTGSAQLTPTLVDQLYGLYMNVYQQSTIHFDLLSRKFFIAVLTDAHCAGVLFLYYHEKELVGFNLCFESEGALIDKYVGFRYPLARDMNLYFVSWFHNLEYAVSRSLRFYVAGWTDPDVKRQLGAKFTWTRHAVYARNPVMRLMLRLLRKYFEHDAAWDRVAAS